MIGAGIFRLTGIAAGKAGPVGLLLAFFLNGVVTLLTGLSYAELGAAIPAAGRGYRFMREGMSGFWGFSLDGFHSLAIRSPVAYMQRYSVYFLLNCSCIKDGSN